MSSPQTLSEPERRVLAGWAADCAARVLPLFEAATPGEGRARDAIARARAYALGELDTAGEIRARGGGGARVPADPAAAAAAKAAGQAAAVAHMGAHALGAAGYAAKAASLAVDDHEDALLAEVRWQLSALSREAADALRRLPPLGEDRSGPLGPGLLAASVQGHGIRELQAALALRRPRTGR